VEALLNRHQGQCQEAQVDGAALPGLGQGLRRGRRQQAKDAGLWLSQRHGIEVTEGGVRP